MCSCCRAWAEKRYVVDKYEREQQRNLHIFQNNLSAPDPKHVFFLKTMYGGPF